MQAYFVLFLVNMKEMPKYMMGLFVFKSMALGSTQPLTEMSTGKIPGGVKGGRRVRLTTLPPFVSRLSLKMWEPQPLTTLWAFTACYRETFVLPSVKYNFGCYRASSNSFMMNFPTKR
jgi:hypothetical protein